MLTNNCPCILILASVLSLVDSRCDFYLRLKVFWMSEGKKKKRKSIALADNSYVHVSRHIEKNFSAFHFCVKEPSADSCSDVKPCGQPAN